jgi:hypothetical protein
MRKSEGCWCQGGPLWLAETLCFTTEPTAVRAIPEHLGLWSEPVVSGSRPGEGSGVSHLLRKTPIGVPIRYGFVE